MGHSVGDQANRAVKKSEKKAAEALRTPEERLSAIRNSLAAKLFVTPTDVKFLLDKYDAVHVITNQSTHLLRLGAESVEILGAEIVALKAQVEQFRAVYEQENRSRVVQVERTLDGESKVLATAVTDNVALTRSETEAMIGAVTSAVSPGLERSTQVLLEPGNRQDTTEPVAAYEFHEVGGEA